MTVSIIVAASENGVIGAGNRLPWYIPEDLRRFKNITGGHAVIVGRLTKDSIVASNGSSLPGRHTVIVTHRSGRTSTEDTVMARSLVEAIQLADEFRLLKSQQETFVIGGASLYAQAVPLAARIYLTRVHEKVEGDSYFLATWLDGFTINHRSETMTSRSGMRYSFIDYIST